MNQFNLDLEGAVEWISTRTAEITAEFILLSQSLPSWGHEVDSKVTRYVDGLGNWVRGNHEWSFENGRYFGEEGATVREREYVTLSPKREKGAINL